MNNFEEDTMDGAADAPEMDATTEERLSALVARQVKLEDEVVQAEAALSAKKKELQTVAETTFVELMDELGYAEIRTADGAKVAVGTTLYASIPKKNKLEAGEWLKDHGQGALVQTTVGAVFNSTEGVALKKLNTICELLDVQVGASVEMNTARIKSMIKEMQEAGKEVPLKLFGVYEKRAVKVTRP